MLRLLFRCQQRDGLASDLLQLLHYRLYHAGLLGEDHEEALFVRLTMLLLLLLLLHAHSTKRYHHRRLRDSSSAVHRHP